MESFTANRLPYKTKVRLAKADQPFILKHGVDPFAVCLMVSITDEHINVAHLVEQFNTALHDLGASLSLSIAEEDLKSSVESCPSCNDT